MNKESFIEYFHSLPGIDPALTNHDLIDTLFKAYNYTPKEERSCYFRSYRRGSGVTETITSFLGYIKDSDILYVSCPPAFRKTKSWLQLSGNYSGQPLIIFDNALSKDQEQSVILSKRFENMTRLLSCPFIVITQYEQAPF